MDHWVLEFWRSLFGKYCCEVLQNPKHFEDVTETQGVPFSVTKLV